MMLWVKSFHIIGFVMWFSGLFYLPRLFVYHAMSYDNISNTRFKIMERKLYYIITTPGAALTILFGSWLLFSNHSAYSHMIWLHIKLILVAILCLYHVYLGYLVAVFQQDKNKHSSVYYRWLNEFPTVILITVVILTIVKP